MTEYELTIEHEDIGVEQREVSEGELVAWLHETAEDIAQGESNIERFKVSGGA